MTKKLTELTANTALAGGDIIPIVDDPGGTPLTQKITFTNFIASIVSLLSAALTAAHAAVVGNVNTSGGIPVLFRITASALTGDVDVVMTHKIRVLDVWCVQTAAGGAGDTITVKSTANAITDAIDCNKSDAVISRAGTIDDANHEIAAAGILRVSGASAVTCQVYVLAIRVA